MRCLIIVFALAFFVAPVWAQNKTVAPVSSAEANISSLSSDDIKTLLEIKSLQATLDFCGIQTQHTSCIPHPAEKLTELYAKAMKRPVLARGLIGLMFAEYTGNRAIAKSAPQASQVADEVNVNFQMVIMAQNQKIIELLEQLVKKKP